MNLLYIDPGTGSMLFTILFGLVTTLYFVGRTAWLRLGTMLAGRDARAAAGQDGRETLVLYSEGKRYWNVFAPIVEALEARGIPASFLSSEADDLVFDLDLHHVKARYIGSGNAAFARLNMLEAELCLMTTPGLDVYQLKRSKRVAHYAHIMHSVDDATSYRLFGLDYFDSVLLTGSYQAAAIRELESVRKLPAKDLPVVGCTYLDVYAAKAAAMGLPDKGQADESRVDDSPDKPFTVLVSPSWGDSALLRRYGMALLGPLAASGHRIIVRPHPQSVLSEADTLASLKAGLAGYGNVEWDLERENLAALSRADIMISDFSGIVFDYAFLFGRPVLYAKADFDPRPYDASDVRTPPWKFEALARLGRELKPEDFPHIGQLVRSMKADPGLAAEIAAVRDEAWQHRGEAGARTVDWLVATLETHATHATHTTHATAATHGARAGQKPGAR